jgi:hypothetical protein
MRVFWGPEMFFFRISKALLAVGALSIVMMQPAAAQSGGYGEVPREVINGVVQNIIQSVRDVIYRRRVVPPPGAVRIPFSGETGEFDSRNPFAEKGMSNPFAAMAYAKSPILAPVAAPVWLYGANLIGSGDRADSRSEFTGTVTHVQTVTGAFDVTKIGIFTASDALTFIGTGSHSWSRAENSPLFGLPSITDSSIPSASGTLAYLNGGFSADFTALASWTRSTSNQIPVVVIPDSSSISYTGNAQYRFDFPYTVWFEPTAGVTYTELYTANFGTKFGDTTEVHGGGRVGFETKWMGFTIQPTLSGQVYKIVDSNFPTVFNPLLPAFTAIQSNLGGRGSGKITVIWTPQFSSYLEVHGSGTAPTSRPPFVVLGQPQPFATQVYGMQAGLRYTW